MILHTINKTSAHEGLNQQLSDVIDTNDSVILIENGVYQAQQLSQHSSKHWSNTAKHIYILKEDALARGIALDTSKLSYINYAEFVELSLLHEKVTSWY